MRLLLCHRNGFGNKFDAILSFIVCHFDDIGLKSNSL